MDIRKKKERERESEGIKYWRNKFSKMAEIRGTREHVIRIERGRGDNKQSQEVKTSERVTMREIERKAAEEVQTQIEERTLAEGQEVREGEIPTESIPKPNPTDRQSSEPSYEIVQIGEENFSRRVNEHTADGEVTAVLMEVIGRVI